MNLFRLPVAIALILTWSAIAINPVRSQSGNMSDITMPNPGEMTPDVTGGDVSAEGDGTTDTSAEGETTEPSTEAATAGGETTEPSTEAATAEGETTEPSTEAATAGGETTEPSAEAATAEGETTEPSAEAATAEGETTEPSAEAATAEGEEPEAPGETPMEESIVDNQEIPGEETASDNNNDVIADDTSGDDAIANDSDTDDRNTVNENVMEAIAGDEASEPKVISNEDELGVTVGESASVDTPVNSVETAKPSLNSDSSNPSEVETLDTVTVDDAPIVEDTPTKVTEDTATVEDTPTTVTEDTATVEDTPTTATEDTATVKDTPTTVTEDTATVEDTPTTVTEDTATVEDSSTTATEDTATVKDTPTKVTEDTATVEDSSTTATEDTATVEDTATEDNIEKVAEDLTEEMKKDGVATTEETEAETDKTAGRETTEEEATEEIAEETEETTEETEETEEETAEAEDDSQDFVQEVDRLAYEVQVQKAPTDIAIQMQEEFQLTQLMGTSGLQLYGQVPSVKNISSRLAELGQQTGKKPAFVNISLQSDRLEAFVVLPDRAIANQENSLVATTELNKIDSTNAAQALTIRETIKDTSRKDLIATATQFRQEVSDSSKLDRDSYLQSSQELYKVLIEPIEAQLEANDIDILVFSMDSGLRLLPLAALHDGEQFLIEKYALAIVPSFGLTDTRYVSLDQSSILAMGASEFTEQAALPTMPIELETIVSQPRQGEVFINEQFTLDNFRAQNQRETPFPIVHLGTHAEFKAGSLDDSYIQFYDDKLRIPQLQELSSELGWNSDATPIELLVLSACETALGDEQAELGFAGLAVQAGVKSALASLWYVSDVGTLALMGEFYDRLGDTLIKAEALRQTQLKMLSGSVKVNNKQVELSNGQSLDLPPDFPSGTLTLDHPYFWSSFTLIGNWN